MKRIMCLVLASFILMGCLYVTTSAQEEALKLGDYITFGKYNGEDIVWRYVADDENGKLMLSDEILCRKNFDSGEGEGDGRHQAHSHYFGNVVGSSRWSNSNIRSWLISDADEGEVVWLCNIPPSDEEEKKEKGFLHSDNFSDSEKSLIKTVMLNTALDMNDYQFKDGGEELNRGALSITYSTELDDDFYRKHKNQAYEMNEETVFLLDMTQLMEIRKNKDILFSNDDVLGTFTLRSAYNGIAYYSHGDWDYGSYVHNAYYWYGYFAVGCQVSFTEGGIRPAFYLNEENAQILSGFGTREDPYVIDGKPVPERFEENSLYGYKDKEGNVIVPAKYLKAWEFSEGAALVVLSEDPYRLRYIDTTGNYLFDKAFYASNNFNNGYALVLTKDDPKYSYIDKTGEFATEILFDDAEDFCGGYARVNMNGKWGVIDTNFNFIVPCEYDNKDEVSGKIK